MKNELESELMTNCNKGSKNEFTNPNFGNTVNDSSIHVIFSYEELFQMINPDLFAHLSRVEFYVRLFCIELAFSGYQKITESDCILLGNAAFFHDIGKFWIPQDILMKSDKLTVEESLIVKNHTKYGKDTIIAMKSIPFFSKIPKLLDLAVAASLSHHEWWNGEGYPFGIAGQDIPFIARLTSICDAFDVITYGRPYCNARSSDDAFCEIKKHAGSQFDPFLSNFLIQHKDIFLKYTGMLLMSLND